MTSRRHEQAEREMIAPEVMDGAKGRALRIGGFLPVAWPWYLFKDHNQARAGQWSARFPCPRTARQRRECSPSASAVATAS